jgi:hypothetical protein
MAEVTTTTFGSVLSEGRDLRDGFGVVDGRAAEFQDLHLSPHTETG